MKASDIRLINSYSSTGRVFIHLCNGRTVSRFMDARDINRANRIGNIKGEDARKEEYARLYNEVYNDWQKHGTHNSFSYINPEMERYAWLNSEKSLGMPLPQDMEDELRELEKKMYYCF